jgi:hypothetical protein
MIGEMVHEDCSQINMEGKSFLAARSPDSPLCCCQLRKDHTMSTQNSITAVDAEVVELDATRAVYDMLKPLGCEAQTRVLDHVYCLLRQAGQKQECPPLVASSPSPWY